MATYEESENLMRRLRSLVNQCIEDHPLVRSAIKVQKAVVKGVPDKANHRVAITFLSDLCNTNAPVIYMPYNPNIPDSDLQTNSVVYVWYYQSLSNGVIMQNANWTI